MTEIVFTEEDLAELVPYQEEDYEVEMLGGKREAVKEQIFPEVREKTGSESSGGKIEFSEQDLTELEPINTTGETRSPVFRPYFTKSGEEYSALETPLYAAGNFPSSAANLASNVVIAASDPPGTFAALIDLSTGYLSRGMSDDFNEKRAMKLKEASRNKFAKSEEYRLQSEKFDEAGETKKAQKYRTYQDQQLNDASALADKIMRETTTTKAVDSFYKERYGGWPQAKKAFAEDPAGVLADFITVLKAGKLASIATKTKTGKRVGDVLDKGAKIAELPFTGSYKGAKKGIQLTGQAFAELFDRIGPNIGTGSMATAFKSGLKGQKEFFDSMLNPEIYGKPLVDKVKAEFNKIKMERGRVYKKQMAELNKSEEILSFKEIEELMQDIKINRIKYKTNKPNVKYQKRWNLINKKIKEYKKNKLNKPEDFDQLKRDINEINSDILYGSEESSVFSPIQAKVRETIRKQSPVYDEIMGDYINASQYIDELNADFALNKGQTGKSDSALRKLQSIFRNNANTNYGARIGNIKQILDDNPDIEAGLAGMNMSAGNSRGLGGAVQTSVAGIGGLSLGALSDMPVGILGPAFATYMAAQSPRVVGSLLYGAGSGLRKTNELLGKVPTRAFQGGADVFNTFDDLLQLRQAPRRSLRLGGIAESLNNPDDKYDLAKEAFKQYKKAKGLLYDIPL